MIVAHKIQCRLFEEKDMQKILNLWENYSGWGPITEKQYHDWFINQPYGKCIIVVAEDVNLEIVGNVIFSPTYVFINGTNIKALRLAAPIIKNEARMENIRSEEHLTFKMFHFGASYGREHNYSLLYSFPSRGWLVFFKALPNKGYTDVFTAMNDCYAISLNSIYSQNSDSSIYIEPITTFDERFDKLWIDAVQSLQINCSVVRNSQWLNWKLGGHLVFAVMNSKSKNLIGYIAINKKTSLIVDVFATTLNDIQNVILCTIHFLNTTYDKTSLPFTELKIMKSPFIADIITSPLFHKIDFNFAFAGCLLDKNIKLDHIKAEKWFMMPND